jgi:hypothetical protein
MIIMIIIIIIIRVSLGRKHSEITAAVNLWVKASECPATSSSANN